MSHTNGMLVDDIMWVVEKYLPEPILFPPEEPEADGEWSVNEKYKDLYIDVAKLVQEHRKEEQWKNTNATA